MDYEPSKCTNGSRSSCEDRKKAMSDLSELREGNAVHVINHGCDDGTMTYMSKLGKAHAV